MGEKELGYILRLLCKLLRRWALAKGFGIIQRRRMKEYSANATARRAEGRTVQGRFRTVIEACDRKIVQDPCEESLMGPARDMSEGLR